jgi:integrase
MLTNASVKAARPRAAAYKMGDGQGLYLAVLPTGTKSFRMKAKLGTKELLLTFGCWPEISLADARDRRDQARARLAAGLDPRVEPATETFEAIARAWHAHRAPTWSHAGDVLVSLERDAFLAIGARAIGAIGAPEILALLEAVAGRAPETARRLCQRLSSVFRFAIARELASADPAAAVADELARARPVQRHPALVDLGEIHALLERAAELRAGAAVQLASRFLALTAVRLAAVRGARWCEIEDLDGAAPAWRIPAARMKLAAAKKGDAKHDHVVPLSRQSVAVLRAANMHRGDANMHDLIFAGAGGGAIGEAAIGDLYKRAGFAGRHVPHGWRASFSTILNERGDGRDRAAIDQALAHTPKDRVEAAYNRATRLDTRRRLFQEWADLIEPARD